MAQIVQGPPSLAERIGTGLGSGLQQLAQMKLNELSRQKDLNNLGNFYESINLPRQLVYAPEKIQQAYLQGASALGALGEPNTISRDQARYINMLQGYEPIAEPNKPSIIPQDTGLQQLLGPLLAGVNQKSIPANNLSSLLQQPKIPQAPQLNEGMGSGSSVIQRAKPTAAQILSEGLRSPAERAAEKKLAQQERHFQEKNKQEERKLAFKETKEDRRKIIEAGKQADVRLEELDRLSELNEKGDIDTAGYVEGLKRAGLDIPSLLSPDSEEYQKTALGLLRGASQVFGGKVSNYEAEQWIKTIPTLLNSPEGRKRLIANWKRISRLDKAYVEAMKEVVKENDGTPPLDLLEKIDDKIGSKQEKIAKKFKEDLSKPVPKGQNKFITAAQTTAGTIAGRIPKAAASAGLGAYAGSKFGPLGTIGGGILGGLAGLGGVGVKDLI